MLWKYTWADILEYLSQIPNDRIIKISPGEKKHKLDEKYMTATCDRHVDKVDDSQMVDFLSRLNKSKGVTP